MTIQRIFVTRKLKMSVQVFENPRRPRYALNVSEQRVDSSDKPINDIQPFTALSLECIDVVLLQRVCRRSVTLQHRSKDRTTDFDSDVALIGERQDWNIMSVWRIRTHPVPQNAG